MSENDIIKKLEERYKKGEISKETYESIVKESLEENAKEESETSEEEYEDERKSGVGIAGSGTVENVKGEYLKISGSGKVEGDVDVREVKIAGSAKIEGDVRAEKVNCAGSCKIEGDLKAREVKVAGAMSIEGRMESDLIYFSGGIKVKGDINSKLLKSAGGTKCEGRITAEERIEMGGSISAEAVETPAFTGKGSMKVDGPVKCRNFRLEMKGSSSAESITSAKVEIISGSSKGIISRIFGKGGSMKAKRIKGKTVHIENTVADVVEGENVNIGPGCRVKILKAEKAQVHESSSVTKRERKEE